MRRRGRGICIAGPAFWLLRVSPAYSPAGKKSSPFGLPSVVSTAVTTPVLMSTTPMAGMVDRSPEDGFGWETNHVGPPTLLVSVAEVVPVAWAAAYRVPAPLTRSLSSSCGGTAG